MACRASRIRDNTERPVTIEQGTNTLVGADARNLAAAFADFQATGGKRGRVPELWDGRAGERVATVVAGALGGQAATVQPATAG